MQDFLDLLQNQNKTNKQKKNTPIFGLHVSFPSSANKAKGRSYKNHCIHYLSETGQHVVFKVRG